MNKSFSIRKNWCALASAVCLTFVSFNASAQVPPEQTGIASPDRVQGQFKAPEFEPQVQPQVEVRELRLQDAPDGAEDIVFDLTGIVIDGATVYSSEEMRSVYANRLGTTITLADLYVIAADLTRKYRNDGYILTQVIVPPQTIDGGIASLKVVEGYIDEIEVRGEGEEQGALNLIRDYLANVKQNSVLNAKDLERSLLLINDLPGLTARAILSPSQTQTGAADLLILVQRKAYNAVVGIDNYGTRFLGPVQVNGSIALNSFFGNNERITAQTAIGLSSGEKVNELTYLALKYDQPIFDNGTLFTLFGSYTATVPGFTLDEFDVRGYSQQVYARLSHPFIRSRAFNFTGRVTFDYREVTSQNNLIIDPTKQDHIRALRIGGNVEYLDTLIGLAFNSIDVELSKGLDIMGANSERQENVSRPGADPEFFKLAASIQRLQRLSRSVNLLLAFRGQMTNQPVLSSEEFSIGGINNGRGFDSSEAIGNDGYAGKIELQWSNPYHISNNFDYETFGFFDAGRVFDSDATAAKLEEETLTSVGAGIRADIYEDTSASLLMAWPLNNTPGTQGDRDPRLFFSVSRKF